MKFYSSIKKFAIVLILILLIIIFSIIAPAFLSFGNFINIARQISMLAILSVGMTFVLLTGGIDLSIGSVISLLCVVLGLLLRYKLPAIVVIIIGIAIASIIGFINGILISKIKVPSLISTLGMATVLRGVTFVLCGGIPIYGIPNSIKVIGQGYIFKIIPIPVVIMIIILIAGEFILRKMYIGRYFYAVGSNEEASKLSGLNTDKIRILVYTICGGLAGLAGAIMLGRIGSGQPNAGTNFEMDVLTAVVLGGVSLIGGKGNISGVLVGVLIIGILQNGMSLAGVSEFYQIIVKGVVLLLAVIIDSLQYIVKSKKVLKISSLE